MDTRLYYALTIDSSITVDNSPEWDVGYTAHYYYCSPVKQEFGTSAIVLSNYPAISAPKSILVYTFISDALVGSGTISGIIKGQILAYEPDSDADWCRAIKIRIFSYDGSVERGAVLEHFPESLESEFSSITTTNRRYPPELSLIPVDYQENDRIVIEIGYRSFSEDDFIENGHLFFTDNNETDLPEDETTETAYNSWIEFSQDLEFKERVIVSQNLAQIATSQVPKIIVSQNLAQILYSKPDTIRKFNSDGNLIASWGSYGVSEGHCRSPHGIKNDSLGNIYVADTGNHRIQKFDLNRNFLLSIGSYGTGDAEFSEPYDLDIDSDGNIYVADTGNHRIQKFTSEGVFVIKWGSGGSGDGQFDYPYGITVDDNNNIYVADTGNHRIQKFTSEGVFVIKWGSGGSGDGQFDEPIGVAVDNEDMIYIVDSGNNRIQKFDPSGVFVIKWAISDDETTEPTRISRTPNFSISTGIMLYTDKTGSIQGLASQDENFDVDNIKNYAVIKIDV